LPAEWLDALPFDGWSIPGALLLGLIGIPGLVGATVETLGRRWVVPWSLAYGVGLVAWIGVQVLLIPPFFLQPVIAAAGTVIAAASWARLRLTHHRDDPCWRRDGRCGNGGVRLPGASFRRLRTGSGLLLDRGS
jgi:hypothetical protein